MTVEAYPTPAQLVPYVFQSQLAAVWEYPGSGVAGDIPQLTWTAPVAGTYVVMMDIQVNGGSAVAGDQWVYHRMVASGAVVASQPGVWGPGAYVMCSETYVVTVAVGDIVKFQGWKSGSGGHVYAGSPESRMTVTGYVPLGGVPAPVPSGGQAGSMLQKVSAADYNTQWGTAPLSAKVTRQAVYGVTNTAWNRIPMDTTEYDPNGLWSGTGFTLPAGIWHVWGHMSFMPSTGGSARILGLGDSSVTNRYADNRRSPLPSAAFDIGCEIYSIVRFTAPTLVELWVYQDSGGTLNTFNNSTWNGHACLAVFRVAGL